jgi:hypothetical protein
VTLWSSRCQSFFCPPLTSLWLLETCPAQSLLPMTPIWSKYNPISAPLANSPTHASSRGRGWTCTQ